MCKGNCFSFQALMRLAMRIETIRVGAGAYFKEDYCSFTLHPLFPLEVESCLSSKHFSVAHKQSGKFCWS